MRTTRPRNRALPSRRRGTAAVEAALMLPMLIIVSFGAVDVAQYINLAQLVSNASRVGARIASRDSTKTVEEVENAVIDYLADTMAHLSKDKVKKAVRVEVKKQKGDASISGGKLTSVKSGDPISIEVAFDFSTVRWLSGPEYWNHNVQDSKTVCRRD